MYPKIVEYRPGEAYNLERVTCVECGTCEGTVDFNSNRRSVYKFICNSCNAYTDYFENSSGPLNDIDWNQISLFTFRSFIEFCESLRE